MTKKRKAPSSVKTDDFRGIRDEYKRKLHLANQEEENVRNIVRSMMFSMGDAVDPLQENENLVLDMLKNELVLLFNDIFEVNDAKKKTVNLRDLLLILKDQHGLISRFLAYINNRIEMAKYMKTKSNTKNCRETIYGEEVESEGEEEQDKNDEDGDVDDFGDVSGEEGEYLSKKRKKLTTTQIEMELMDEVHKCFKKSNIDVADYENFDDEIYKKRQKAFLRVIEDMPATEYNKFTMARRVTFQKNCIKSGFDGISMVGRKNKSNNLSTLLKWLGNPPITGEPAEIFIAFLAKEVIGELVLGAVVEKDKEPPNVFRNDHHGDPTALQVRHFEEVLRKHQKFRKFGRLFV